MSAVIRVSRGLVKSGWDALKTAPATGWFGLIVVPIYLLVAVLAPLLAPYGEAQVVGDQYLPWGSPYLLGTDHLGRDILSRMIYGAHNSIGIAVVTTSLSFLVGGFLGMCAAATLGGWIDQVLSRIVDVLMAIPQLIFILVLLLIFGTSIISLVLVIAVLDSTRVFRLTRAAAMNIVVQDFVEAARLQGESLLWIAAREILPNILFPLIAELGLRFCFVFLTIATLSFLGLGMQPPTADWGSMVRENAALIDYGNITPLLPAGAIALLAIAVNLLVDWILHRANGLGS
jgi:peptide/nickel transport system permease protein